MKTYVVKRRYGNEEWDIRQFVQPNTPGVVDIADSLPRDENEFISSAWEWVLNNVAYPTGSTIIGDRHYQESFLGKSFQKYLTYEFWSFPAETLAARIGDCEDTSFLLASILRNRLPLKDVQIGVGNFGNIGHVWVIVRGMILETTRPDREQVIYTALPETGKFPYAARFKFNDQQVIELQEFSLQPRGNVLQKNRAIMDFYAGLAF